MTGALLACAPYCYGQTVNVHKADGTVLNISAEDFDYIDFSAADASFNPCPDANHPHLLDLGLPSGVKWACCNVGAAKPEQPGGYYAWGEVEVKDVYNWDTYTYYADGSYTVLGTNISGTIYDAATFQWGAPWKMPTAMQILELLDNTTVETAVVDGKNILKLTANNGTAIYLPIAGTKFAAGTDFDGERGYLWSGDYDPDWDGGAYGMSFGTWGGYWDGGGRLYGRNVRPVVNP